MNRSMQQLVLGTMLILPVACGGTTTPYSASLLYSCPTTANFTFTTVNYPGDMAFTQLLGINDSGVIVGYHGSGADAQHPNKGFEIDSRGAFTDENYPGSLQTQVVAINAIGDTAGFYVDINNRTHGFLRVGGVYTTVDFPNTMFNQLLGLNNYGVAAGYWQDAKGIQYPYTVQGGVFRAITTPGTSAQATGVNDKGDVSGFYLTAAGMTHGFWIPFGKAPVTIDYPAATFTQALGLNNLGDVVGAYTDALGKTHGFIHNVVSTQFESIDEINGVGTTVVNGLNNVGQIVGFYVDMAGKTNGFVGTISSCRY
jgi:uncharacterized membrane protein